MAKITMELRNLMAMPDLKIFNFTYPCEDPAWKDQIEDLFIRTYYFKEIGFETIDRFLYELETKFMTIMPYYNELYKTTKYELSPLIDSKVVETYDGSSATAGDASNNSAGKDFEYPQNDDPAVDLLPSGSSSNSAASEFTNDVSTNYTKTVEGFKNNQAQLVKEYRSSIINITKMLVDECKDLFIRIY